MERWETPDDDFVDVLRLDAVSADAPRILLFHGLEGSPRSHYARALFVEARRRGWGADMLIFRMCNGVLNRTARSYHSGETSDPDFVIRRLRRDFPQAPLFLAGVSLGGNVMLKWLGEAGDSATRQLVAAVAISVPFDLERSCLHIDRGFARVYQWHFLRTLRKKALAKLERFPDLVAREPIEAARTLWEFDDAFTAPVHGFSGARDYYTQSSSIHFLSDIRVPTLLLSARDDPFHPHSVLHEVEQIALGNPALHTEFVARGGHAGFVGGGDPRRPTYYTEWRIVDFCASQLALVSR